MQQKIQFTAPEETWRHLTEVQVINNYRYNVQALRRVVDVLLFLSRLKKDGYQILLQKDDEVWIVCI